MRQKLGQHFLKNKKVAEKILQALEIKRKDIIIEIGSGHGELTKPLFELCQKNKCQKIIAIEKDTLLAKALKKKIKAEVIEADALKALPSLTEKMKNLKFKIVGNIPYYLTGKLLRIIAELKNKPSLIIFTLQKEVGLRICAQPPKMNLLAAAVQYWANPKIIGFISKKNFQPKPKVNSVIIKLLPINKNKKMVKPEKYYKLIKILFKQPRKTILNNLINKKGAPKNLKLKIIKKLEKLNIKPNQRAQELTVFQLITLSQMLYNEYNKV